MRISKDQYDALFWSILKLMEERIGVTYIYHGYNLLLDRFPPPSSLLYIISIRYKRPVYYN